MAKAKTWICREGVLFMLLLMLGTLISFVVEPIVSDARTRRALGDPDAYVTDTRRSPWISIDLEGMIWIRSERIGAKEILVIPDAVDGIKVTGATALHGARGVKTLVLPAGFHAEDKGTYSLHEWEDLETLVVSEGVTNLYRLDPVACPSLNTLYLPSTLKVLNKNVPGDLDETDVVYYAGTEENWATLGKWAEDLSQKCNVVFNTPVPEY